MFQLAGASYMEVHNAGGGINFTVDHTRNATEEKLYELLEERLMRMLRAGSIFTIYQFFYFPYMDNLQ
jgi:imidazolonepropionase